MHILFLTDNFPPEGNAPATRTFEHAREWVAQGHRVTMITCAPNFPEGKVYAGYENKLFQKSELEGIEIRRVKTYITANEGFFKRSLDYLSFMFSGFLAGLFVKKPDVVIATSPQFFCACAGWAVAFCKRKPFVFELRDIWPASIEAVGAAKNSRLIRALEKIELFLYRRAALIVSVTHSFKTDLIERGVSANKISVILNGVDLSVYKPQEKDEALAAQYDLKDKFVVGYVGTHGMAHALDTLVDAAAMLEDDGVVFLFAGGGARAEELASDVQERKLSNVVVMGRQPKERMSAVWSLCDVSIVHLKDTALFSKVIPSKIFESFAMGLPVVIGVPEGEATSLVTKHRGGIVFEPENAQQLSAVIEKLNNDRDLLGQLARNCETAAREFDRKRLARRMLEELQSLTVR